MTDKEKHIQKQRLEAVTDPEWEEALKVLNAWITWRLRYRTAYGAHSERELGHAAVDFYMKEAYLKLAEYVWKWQDDLALADQLIRVASSLIQKREEKYVRRAEAGCLRADVDAEFMRGLDAEEERLLDVAYEKAEAAVKGDAELEQFLEAIRMCDSCDEMCVYLDIDKRMIYNLRKRLIRRLKDEPVR